MARRVSGLCGFFKDDVALLKAADEAYKGGYRRFDVISPFPIHGMDDAMRLRRSWIPYVTFVAGLTGCGIALGLQWYTSAWDWPINVGGKPMFSLPAFVPILFELTVLIGGLATAGALFFACGLPKIDPPIIDPDLTSHKFALFIPENDMGYEQARTEGFLKSIGADSIKHVREF